MKDRITIALISGSLVLLGSVVTQFFELKKRKSDEKRWYADYFLPKKFDSLFNLYASLRSSHGTVGVYRYRKLKNDDEYQRLVVKEINNFSFKFYLASIYLSKSTNYLLSNFQDSLGKAGLHISGNISPLINIVDGVEKNIIVDWPVEIDAQFTDAKKAIAKSLTPDFLKKLETQK